MSTVVFSGPTLSQAQAKPVLLDATFLAPAECGDVYRAVRNGARIVALIDGYFDHRLPVWHKEILWAVAQGVRVYGASSMGALRAAELHSFGMIGIGTVFEWFRDGVLENDDEVAVVHESAERGFRPRSVALVNLRCTVNEAVRAEAIEAGAGVEVIRQLQAVYYPDRGTRALLEAVERVTPSRTRAFAEFLERHGVVDQKRADALTMLGRIGEDGAAPRPSVANFRFQHTNAWQSLVERIDHGEAAISTAEEGQGCPADAHALLRQALERLARTDPTLYARVVRRALQRALSLALDLRQDTSVDASETQRASDCLRLDRGLLTPEQTDAWLKRNGLDVEGFSALVHDTLRAERHSKAASAAFLQEVPAVLRLLGVYEHVMGLT